MLVQVCLVPTLPVQRLKASNPSLDPSSSRSKLLAAQRLLPVSKPLKAAQHLPISRSALPGVLRSTSSRRPSLHLFLASSPSQEKIDKICKVAQKPLVVTYTGLIQACLDSGSIENGTYIFNQMHKFCSPNVVTCNIMLKSYLEHGLFEEAKKLFCKIVDGIHHVDSKTALNQKVIPDKFTFNIMMEAFARAQNWDDFEYSYLHMLHHGFFFDPRRHLRMVFDAFRAGKGQVLEATWEHLVRSGRVLPPALVKERFCVKLAEDDHLAAISCISTHQENEQAFSEESWLNLIKGNANRFKIHTITRLAAKVSELAVKSERAHPEFENLLCACREFVSLNTVSSKLPRDLSALSCDSQLKA